MFLIDRRYFRYFDWVSFFLILLLSAIGLLFVLSSTYKTATPFSLFFKKQLFGIVSGICIYFIFCTLDYRDLWRFGYFFYFAILVLLVITMIKGSIAMGGQRWIDIGIFKFQPSELAKLFLPSFVSYFLLTQKDSPRYSLIDYIPIFIILGISFILIVKQPDLGTALLVLFSGLIMVWFSGFPKIYLFIGLCSFLIASPLLWHLLKPYQQQRILVFFGSGTIHKERYQIEQSKIAIGSGGLTGKGFLKGTQNTLMFLPESQTDFIFSVLCEEVGFIGSSIVLILFLILFLRLFFMIAFITDFFTQLLACGLLIHIVLSTCINISMVTGLLPIVGIPLPFMSYGISNLWVTFASLGWINGILIRRFYT